MNNVPSDLKYTSEHEWVKMEGDLALVGITFHAQAELGDITFVELPEAGAQLKQGAAFGVVESVKAASDLFAPLSGEVVEVNAALADSPQDVNADPYGKGWMLKVRPADKSECGNLLDAAAYSALL